MKGGHQGIDNRFDAVAPSVTEHHISTADLFIIIITTIIIVIIIAVISSLDRVNVRSAELTISLSDT